MLRSDLDVLSRGSAAAAGAAASAGSQRMPSAVPMPPRRWKTRVLLPAGVVLAAAGILAYGARDALAPATGVRVLPVVAKELGSDAGPALGGSVVQAPGWLEADPYAVGVAALADGVVKEVLVLEGERVSAGQVVARLVDDDAKLALARAEAEVAQREAEVRAAEAALAAAVADWENPVERTRAVAATEAQLLGAKAELNRLPAEVAVEEAKAGELADEYKRRSRSFESSAATEAEVIQARLRLEAQKAVVDSTKSRKPLLEAKVAELEAEAKAAREHLKLRIDEAKALEQAKAQAQHAKATLLHAQAARDEATLRLLRMEVRSPADGVVMQRLVEPGAKLVLGADHATSAYAVRLYDPKKLQVRVDVPLADASKVGAGTAAEVVVGVLPDRTFKGKVTRVAHEADVQKNTLQVKVAVDDPAEALRPEMLARVKFFAAAPVREAGDPPGRGSGQRLFVPESALLRDGSAVKAFVVDEGKSTLSLRQLVLGEARQDGWVAVREGLRVGDDVVSGDLSNLRDGQRVKVVGEAGAPGANAKGAGHGAH